MTKIYEREKEVIKIFKSCRPYTVNCIKTIWAKHNACNPEDILLRNINAVLLNLIFRLGLISHPVIFSDFILDLNRDSNWKFSTNQGFLRHYETDFQTILLSRIDYFFTNVGVSKLPGYED